MASLVLLKEILAQASATKVANDLELEKLRDTLFMEIIQNASKLGTTGVKLLKYTLTVIYNVFYRKFLYYFSEAPRVCSLGILGGVLL